MIIKSDVGGIELALTALLNRATRCSAGTELAFTQRWRGNRPRPDFYARLPRGWCRTSITCAVSSRRARALVVSIEHPPGTYRPTSAAMGRLDEEHNFPLLADEVYAICI